MANNVLSRSAGVGGAGLLILLGWVVGNGEKLAAVLGAFWAWVLLVWSQMPAGLLSYVASWALGLAVMWALRHWIPDPGQGSKWNNLRAFVIEGSSGAAAFVVISLQVEDLKKSLIPLTFALVTALTVPLGYRVIGSLSEGLKAGVTRLRGPKDERQEVLPKEGRDEAFDPPANG